MQVYRIHTIYTFMENNNVSDYKTYVSQFASATGVLTLPIRFSYLGLLRMRVSILHPFKDRL